MRHKKYCSPEPMSYIEQRKSDEFLVKYKVICAVKNNKSSRISVAQKFSMHRNTVYKIIKNFEEKIEKNLQEQIISGSNFTVIEIQEILSPLQNVSTKPISNTRSANAEQEYLILRKVCKIALNLYKKKRVRQHSLFFV